MEYWIDRYNNAGIVPQPIPEGALNAARMSGIVVASSLRRARESAQTLCGDIASLCESIFREADLPFASWRHPKLPASVWAIAFRLAWFLGYSAGTESVRDANARARLAAERLTFLAGEYRSVLLVGHGILNALIARHLLKLGWVGPARPARGYWQFNVYLAANEAPGQNRPRATIGGAD